MKVVQGVQVAVGGENLSDLVAGARMPARARSAFDFFCAEHGDRADEPMCMERWGRLHGEDRMVYMALEAEDRDRYTKEVSLLTDRLLSSRSAYDLFCDNERESVVRDIPGASASFIANMLSQRWFATGRANQVRFECLAEQEGARREQRTACIRSRLLDHC